MLSALQRALAFKASIDSRMLTPEKKKEIAVKQVLGQGSFQFHSRFALLGSRIMLQHQPCTNGSGCPQHGPDHVTSETIINAVAPDLYFDVVPSRMSF